MNHVDLIDKLRLEYEDSFITIPAIQYDLERFKNESRNITGTFEILDKFKIKISDSEEFELARRLEGLKELTREAKESLKKQRKKAECLNFALDIIEDLVSKEKESLSSYLKDSF